MTLIEVGLSVLSTVIGGVLLTSILFFLNEYIFAKRNITGAWVLNTKTLKSSFNLYIGLENEYKVYLLQKGSELTGSGEKTKDIHIDGKETIFPHSKRPEIILEGYYERKYLGKSKIYFQVHERGESRTTRAMYVLKFKNRNTLEGTFLSTAAEATGTLQMRKTTYN